MTEKQVTRVDSIIETIKNHPFYARIIIISIAVIAVGNIARSIESIRSLLSGKHAAVVGTDMTKVEKPQSQRIVSMPSCRFVLFPPFDSPTGIHGERVDINGKMNLSSEFKFDSF